MSAYPEPHLSRRSFLAASGLGAASLLLPSRWAPADAAGDPWARADAIAAGITVPTFPDRDFDITRHGAAPDGADATAAIARAVAACSAAGGGRVLVPAGTFHTGPIHLRSGVHLHVAKGAVLRFSTDPGDYLPVVPTSYEGNDCYNYSPLVYAYRQTNIAVTGEGTLDGQASRQHWWPWVPKADVGLEEGPAVGGRATRPAARPGPGGRAGRAARLRRGALPAAGVHRALRLHERPDRGRQAREPALLADPPAALAERHRPRRDGDQPGAERRRLRPGVRAAAS